MQRREGCCAPACLAQGRPRHTLLVTDGEGALAARPPRLATQGSPSQEPNTDPADPCDQSAPHHAAGVGFLGEGVPLLGRAPQALLPSCGLIPQSKCP